jgi:alkanesulfonate monooxygenase SsuD/methylene tetrahydromethanopterin reductase-like flavin-dependent oxidoreductase (luciferase family)
MPAPKFGLALSFQVHQGIGEPWDKSYREGIELAAEANRLGFDSLWVSEHHGEADGYCPSPVVACAALAVAAPNCRIGQAVALAPLHGHPLRLAEDLSVLDNLSGGRVEIGLGQGYRPAEFAMFGWPYARRTTAFEESLDILGLAWRGERFDYEGRIYKVKDGLLRPPPVTPGALPLWIGAAAPLARARAVRHRAGLLVAPLIELEHLVRQIRSFDDEAARQNAGRLPHALMREILVGDSAADAIKRHQPYLDHVYRVQYAPERTGQTYLDPATGERKPLTGDNPHYLSEAFMQDRWFLGTPAEVAAKMISWLPRLAFDHLIFQARQPGMSLRHAISDLEEIAKASTRVRTGWQSDDDASAPDHGVLPPRWPLQHGARAGVAAAIGIIVPAGGATDIVASWGAGLGAEFGQPGRDNRSGAANISLEWATQAAPDSCYVV